MQQVKSHDRVADAEQCLIHGVVGGSARKRLHVDVDLVSGKSVGGKGFGGAAAGERFDNVGIFHAFVIARVTVAAVIPQTGGVIENLFFAHPACFFVGVTFGIDVLERGHQSLAYRHRRGRFAWDEDQFAILALSLELSQSEDVGVEVGKFAAE